MRIKIPTAILSSIGLINWMRQAGKATPASLRTRENENDKYHSGAHVTPGGVIAWHVALLAGTGNINGVSAMEFAATKLYNDWRHKNVSLGKYTAADTLKYILAMGALNSLMGYAYKLINCQGKYDKLNWNYGKLLMDAMGVSPSDDLANDILKYNELVHQINALAIPNNIPLLEDQFDLVTNVFADDTISKTGLFTYVPEYIYVWDRNPESATVGDLILTATGPFQSNVTALLTKISEILGGYHLDEDITSMSSEIMHAYGDNLFTLKEIPITPNWDWTPVVDYDLIDQCHNAITVGRPTNKWDIYEYNGHILCGRADSTQGITRGEMCIGPVVGGQTITTLGDAEEIALYSHDERPSSEQTVVISRFRPIIEIGTQTSDSASVSRITSCGTEVICFGRVAGYAYDATGAVNVYREDVGSFFVSSKSTVGFTWREDIFVGSFAQSQFYNSITFMQSFRSCPILYYLNAYGGMTNGMRVECVLPGDVDNFTYVSKDTLESIHTNVVQFSLIS